MGLGLDAVQAVEHASLSATEAACLSRHHLLNFSEYREVSL
jgi:hypothetical protein